MSEKVETKDAVEEVERGSAPVSMPAVDEAASHEIEELSPLLVSQIEAEVARRFQSAKDKRWAALEKQYGGLHELAARLEGSPEPEQPEEGDFNVNLVKRAGQLLEGTGLGNDPEVVELVRVLERNNEIDTYIEWLEGLTSLVLRRLGKGKASAATVVQPTGGNAAAANLQQAYEQRKKKLRPGDVNGLMRLKREFREKGLEIF